LAVASTGLFTDANATTTFAQLARGGVGERGQLEPVLLGAVVGEQYARARPRE
jgi:hypothetical protein